LGVGVGVRWLWWILMRNGVSTCFLLHLVWKHGCYAYPVRVVAEGVAFAHFVDSVGLL
jgi:hypothetical protein